MNPPNFFPGKRICLHVNLPTHVYIYGFPDGAAGRKNPSASAGDLKSSIPGSERFPGGGHDNPCQYSCLDNPRDRGAWRATGHSVAESETTEAPRMYTYMYPVAQAPTQIG